MCSTYAHIVYNYYVFNERKKKSITINLHNIYVQQNKIKQIKKKKKVKVKRNIKYI